MKIIDKIKQMNVDEFAEWLCYQLWEDYKDNTPLIAIRFHNIRNFLLMETQE